MTRYVRFAGWGMYLPERVLTNGELETMIDTSDEWIRERSGIAERRIAGPDETARTMAVAAARQALEVAGLSGSDLDLIVVATATPDYVGFPATASLVQHDLGAHRAGAFDLAAACTGFVYALATGCQFILSGAYRNVLIVGSEVFSRILDWRDRSTCVLFGDAAGAVVLQATDEPGGLLSFVLGSDGSGAELLYIPAGGSRLPASIETVQQRQHYVRMAGRDVYRFATTIMPDALTQALERAELSASDIDLFIPHQANIRIINGARKRLDLRPDTLFVNVDRYGNTSAASIPVALCEAIAEGRLRRGANLAMVAFGGGLSWGAAIWRWNT